jgi:hypothetical protein
LRGELQIEMPVTAERGEHPAARSWPGQRHVA